MNPIFAGQREQHMLWLGQTMSTECMFIPSHNVREHDQAQCWTALDSPIIHTFYSKFHSTEECFKGSTLRYIHSNHWYMYTDAWRNLDPWWHIDVYHYDPMLYLISEIGYCYITTPLLWSTCSWYHRSNKVHWTWGGQSAIMSLTYPNALNHNPSHEHPWNG